MSVPQAVLNWSTLAAKYAAVHPGLDADEILAIIWTESTGRPDAVNGTDPNGGSWGLMQLTMPTAKQYSQRIAEAEDLLDPDKNVEAGSAYLAHLKNSFERQYPLSDPAHAWVTAYNQGPGNLLKGRGDAAYAQAFIAHLAELKQTPLVTDPELGL